MSFAFASGRRLVPSISRVSPIVARSFSGTASSQYARMTIVGRIVHEPEHSTTANGTNIVKYVVASNPGRKEERQSSFYRVAAFPGEGLQNLLLSLPKGTLVCVEATASMRTYEDPKTGLQRTSLSLLHRAIEILSRPQQENSETSEGSQTAEDHTVES